MADKPAVSNAELHRQYKKKCKELGLRPGNDPRRLFGRADEVEATVPTESTVREYDGPTNVDPDIYRELDGGEKI